MLADFLTATATPVPTPTESHGAYDWWSDIWLPALTGTGSIVIAVIAVAVARRSNRLARAATRAADRSNAIARRANEQEQARAAQQKADAERRERRNLADRYLEQLEALSVEMGSDPEYWTRLRSDQDGNAIFQMSPIVFEASVRGWSDFPDPNAVGLLRSAEKAGGGLRRRMLARNGAHVIVNTWVETPDRLARMIELIEKDTADRMA